MAWTLEQYFKGMRKPPGPPPADNGLKLGWKYLVVEGHGRHFVSPLYGTEMEPNKTMVAECGVYGNGHSAPVPSCLCGFHMGSRANDPCLLGYKMASTWTFRDSTSCNTLGLFICSGRCIDHRSGFRAEKALLAGVFSTDAKIAERHPNLIMAGQEHELECKVREAYSNGYWNGSPVVPGGPHTSVTRGYSGMGSGFYSRGSASTTGPWNTWLTASSTSYSRVSPSCILHVNRTVCPGDLVTINTGNASVTVVAPSRADRLIGYQYLPDGTLAMVVFARADGSIEYVTGKQDDRPN